MPDHSWKPGIKKQPKAIITGASTGIGRAVALQLAKDHAAKIVLNARGKEDLEAAAEQVRKVGGEAICVTGDVSERDLTQTLVDTCKEKFGGVDILVNNAGLAKSGPMKTLSVDDWRYVFEVNFFASLQMIYGVLPHFIEQGHGKVVNVASVAGKVAFPGSVCYASSKFAMTGLSEGMAAEFAGKIDVITACPGWVRTDFFKRNKLSEDPTLIAQENNVRGWMMRNILSISSEQAANDIVRAMEKGGSHEIVLTAPGLMVERMAALFPNLTFYLTSLVPAERHQRGQHTTSTATSKAKGTSNGSASANTHTGSAENTESEQKS